MKALNAMDLCLAVTRIFWWGECPLSLFLKYSRTVLTQELVLFNTWFLGVLAGSLREPATVALGVASSGPLLGMQMTHR